ncbi:hypothetical protein PG990_014466 [Apiospora arundinis]
MKFTSAILLAAQAFLAVTAPVAEVPRSTDNKLLPPSSDYCWTCN